MALEVPDRAALDSALARAEKRQAFWDAHRVDFTARYPDQFVAVVDAAVVDHDADLMALVQRLRAAGHDVRSVWIEFMATDRHKLLV
jgi:hypothetical protein